MHVNPVALVQSKEVVVLASIFTNPILEKVVVLGALVSMLGINEGIFPYTTEAGSNGKAENKFRNICKKNVKWFTAICIFAYCIFCYNYSFKF